MSCDCCCNHEPEAGGAQKAETGSAKLSASLPYRATGDVPGSKDKEHFGLVCNTEQDRVSDQLVMCQLCLICLPVNSVALDECEGDLVEVPTIVDFHQHQLMSCHRCSHEIRVSRVSIRTVDLT